MFVWVRSETANYSPSLGLHLLQLEVLVMHVLHKRSGARTAIEYISQQLAACVMQGPEERERDFLCIFTGCQHTPISVGWRGQGWKWPQWLGSHRE